MTSKWSKSEEKSTEALKSDYLTSPRLRSLKISKHGGVKKLSKRSKVYRRKDAKIYNKTANKTKSINLTAKPMRGGIRL